MRLIDTEGLDEEIRCEICRNPMHTSRGCDGNCTYDEKLYEKIMQILDRRIKQLPSAQPERKKGRWIIKDNPGTGWYRVTCSECGEDVTSTAPCIGFYPNAKVTWDYCPNCGALMDGEVEGRKK